MVEATGAMAHMGRGGGRSEARKDGDARVTSSCVELTAELGGSAMLICGDLVQSSCAVSDGRARGQRLRAWNGVSLNLADLRVKT